MQIQQTGETYDELSYRVRTGFEDIAHRIEKMAAVKRWSSLMV